MHLSEQILEFYNNLNIDQHSLPRDVQVLNPYKEAPPEIDGVVKKFYRKFYADEQKRGLILGINPGRFGAGITGIPFTDSYRLEENCGIRFPGNTRETSSEFVYEFIEAYGGAEKFYQNWFIGATCPLGFTKLNKKGNWVNWNYYDEKELQENLMSFITDKLREQQRICGNPSQCVVLGTGKNYKFLKELNKTYRLFESIHPLEHPRYIMQYRLKKKDEYILKYLKLMSSK